jgi:hypothetical protein
MPYYSSGFLGRVVAALLILVVVIAAIGFWRDWWDVAMFDDAANDEIELQVNVDKQRIREDASTAAREAREAAETVSVAADVESVRGTVTEATAEEITIRAENDATHSFQLTDAAEIEIDGQAATPQRIPDGRQALISYRENAGTKTVLKVKVL